MLVDDLYNDEYDNISDTKLAHTVRLLKEAITDWPTDIKTVENFIHKVKVYLKRSAITIDIIERIFCLAFVLLLFSCNNRNDIQQKKLINFKDIPDKISDEDILHLKYWSMEKRYKNAVLVRRWISDTSSTQYIVYNYDSVLQFKIPLENKVYLFSDTTKLMHLNRSEINLLYSNVSLFNSLDLQGLFWRSTNLLYFEKDQKMIIYKYDTMVNMDSLIPSYKFFKINSHWYKDDSL